MTAAQNRFSIIDGKWHHASASASASRRLRQSVKRSFAAAKADNLTASFAGSYLPINEELRRGLRRMRARSRQLSFNSDHMRRFLQMVKINIIGTRGILLQARAKNDDRLDEHDNRLIEMAWREFGKPRHCTVTGRHSWLDVQNIAAASTARDGEVLIQMIDKPSHPFGFVLRLYPADYLDEMHNETLPGGHKIIMGVEVDADGMVQAYHLRDGLRGAYQNVYQVKKYRRIPAGDMIHFCITDHPDQVRGVPWAHSAIRRLNTLGGYEEAELVAARIGASKMGFYTSPDGGNIGVDDLSPDSEDLDESDLIDEVDPGTFHNLPAGVDFTGFDPQHPTTAYDPFVKACLRGIASGMNVSYHGLTGDLENVNFSSIRAGTLSERDAWRVLQQSVIEHISERVYERWLRSALLSRKLMLPFKQIDKYRDVHWQPRGWPWVDPAKDAKAHNDKIASGTGTRTKALSDEGQEFEETIDRLQYEQQYAAERGVDISVKQSTPEVPDATEDN